MAAKKLLLVAEDSVLNQRILKKILSSEYDILMAENGEIALSLLQTHLQNVSAMILDLTMPVMDGFTVLQHMQTQEAYRNVPVVVATGSADEASETKALALGAWDFVSKPYNPEIIRFRLRNAIDRSQLNLLEQIRYQAEHDALTGLYNARKFRQAVRAMLSRYPENSFAMVRLDVNRFKQINILYGTEAGDEFLKFIASTLEAYGSGNQKCVYSHQEADVFALCIAYEDQEALRQELTQLQKQMKLFHTHFDVSTCYGVYIIENADLSVEEMVDRATLAAKKEKGSYLDTITFYDMQMGKALLLEQEITSEMTAALEQEQFCVFFQPKYNIATEYPCGAEALVRWRHPAKGLISPGVFIPVFEKNGFIAKMDYFVWEKTCQYLKKWCDLGRKPYPISANVSRVNLNNPELVSILTSLVHKYGIEPRLLQLEITETAYMDNPTLMDRVVREFHEQGFTILMDDFGSGYSSLNTLKDISVDILKLDMKFLPAGQSNSKSEKILASIVRMADWLGMPVVVEGVETKAQKDFLRGVGCLYVQGYYYGRPMPVEDYETLIARQVETLPMVPHEDPSFGELEALLSSDPNTETVLSGISMPVGIYEYINGRYDRIRANQSFYDTFGYHTGKEEGSVHMPEGEQEKLSSAFSQVASTHASADSEVLMALANGMAKWFRVSFRYILSSKRSHLICAVFTDISQEKQVQGEMNRIIGILNQREDKLSRMLVVDDSDVNRGAVKALFEQEFKVLEAENGREALDLLSVHKDEIAIILLDMIMPVMDGREFLAIKNHREEISKIPVVVISSDQREESQVSMLRSGVNDYITKPFVPETTYRRVKNVLEYQSRFTEMLMEYHKAISLSPAVSSSLDQSYLAIGEVRALVLMMGQIFDVVRVVDPKDTAVITVDENDEIHRAPYSCFRVWNKQTRCENCTSGCAMETGCQLTKYEFIENDIFYVISRPLVILLGNGKNIRVILEIVSHVSDSLINMEINGVPIRELMDSTRRKIYCDPLTGAYNRRFLYEMIFLRQGANQMARSITAIMMDMNGFKSINDLYGHTEGDRVLNAAAKALQANVRPTDAVVRFGGDEFVVILCNCRQEQIEKKISNFIHAIHEITYGDKGEIHADAKFGYAYTTAFQPTREYLDELIRKADEDMYLKRTAEMEKESDNR